LSFPGTVPYHQHQSLASLANFNFEIVLMSVESKSKTATLTFFSEELSDFSWLLLSPVSLSEETYRPTISVESTVLHDNFSGDFLETGVKKLDTAAPSPVLE
jgi:hypothetical protein